MLGIVADDDDDGNAATAIKRPALPVNAAALIPAGQSAAEGGTEALRSWYKTLTGDEKAAVAASLDALKQKAQQFDLTEGEQDA
jgi:hypothetical protein